MNKDLRHILHHARKHHKAHLRLKELLSKPKEKERIWSVFLITFFIVLFSLLIFRNWGTIVNLFKSRPTPPTTQFETDGFQDGVLSVYKVDRQATRSYRNLIASILTSGSVLAAENNMVFGKERGVKPKPIGETLKNSVWLTNYLSTGQHLTRLEQKRARALQKSILSTYYLGEKTVNINNILELDSKILSQIRNTLSVDLFQYLNQAVIRADALSEYLNLLNKLVEKTNQRIADLESKVNFLSANFEAKEREIELSEETFFENLKIFDGPNAQEELGRFVGAAESQVEIRAKIGAYDSLKGYYEFFKPRLENLIAAIQANRGPLIAGVKVVEIQNMSLPLIIRQR